MDLFIEMKAKTGKFQELVHALTALMPALHITKGCEAKSCIYQDVQERDQLLLSLQFQDAEELRRCMSSDHGGAIVGAISLLGEKIRVRIDTENVITSYSIHYTKLYDNERSN